MKWRKANSWPKVNYKKAMDLDKPQTRNNFKKKASKEKSQESIEYISKAKLTHKYKTA